jgi:hypothetical protein
VFARVLVTIGVLIYALAVPVLEINDTHVFNPEWPPHARLHEVWQLATNSMIGLLSLWLAWGKGQVRLSALLALLVMGGFLLAYALRDLYGGSMVLVEGSAERTLLGLNLGVVGAAIVVATALAVLALESRRRPLATRNEGYPG